MADDSLSWPTPEEVIGALAAAVPGEIVAVDPASGEWGGQSYALTVASDDPAWAEPVVARVARRHDRLHAAAAGGEAAWLAHVGGHGIGVPSVVATVLDDDVAATVMARSHEQSMVEAISSNPTEAADLLARAGHVNVAIHAVPIVDAPAALGATDVVAAAADAATALGLADELAWLGGNRPPAVAEPVVCHGSLQPAQIRLDMADPDGLVVTTWTEVTVDDRERDVAQTSLALWSIPYLAQRRTERMMLKLFRDTLIANYQDGYVDHAGVDLDPALLGWWRAAHVLDWTIRLEQSRRSAVRDPWDPVHLVDKADAFGKDLRAHFWDQARDIDR